MALEQKVIKLDENLIKEKSELGEVMDNLDSDRIDTVSNMSSIDFNSRLTATEIKDILILDEFIRLGIMNKNIGLGRQKKRLSVSLGGLGRSEKVQIVAGDRENKSGRGIGDRLAGLFQRRD